MELKENSAAVKLYNFFVYFGNRLIDRDEDYDYEHYIKPGDRTDICTYGRRILIWGPLSIAIYVAMYSFGLYFLIYRPFMMFGAVGLSGYAYIVGVPLVIFAVLFTIAAVYHYTSLFLANRKEKNPEACQKVNSLKAVSSTWYKSFKDKTCVMINVKDK